MKCNDTAEMAQCEMNNQLSLKQTQKLFATVVSCDQLIKSQLSR